MGVIKMKYIAVFNDEFLSDFRVDTGYPSQPGLILIVKDKYGCLRGIRIKPLARELLVTKDGDSVYLKQSQIDCLIEMERKDLLESFSIKET